MNVVLGDFNVDLMQSPRNPLIKKMTENDYIQIISKPTTSRNTLIDHIYVKGTSPVDSGVLPTYYSYHEVTYLAV